ncbi:hypothetical protein [Rhizosaccharibacter radicis]|uniref:DUF3035 domain-containing protein n=1 Tax=Rhizosaccharibacter radicis TaxID=2782605 RepID=A0ABT1VWY8_9PROT|nr:hypothetical protein [Acetobacteraceae bacterium KSS12]
MRRSFLVAPVRPAIFMLPVVVSLGGCSGLGKFFGDTATLPGWNPNHVEGVSENLRRARGQTPAEVPIEPEDGNMWPGPPQPLPTLADVAKRTGLGDNGAGNPLGGPAALRSGGSMSMGEQNAISGGVPVDSGFGGGVGLGGGAGGGAGVLHDSVPDASAKFRSTDKGSDIVIPNGDGTSTVISPDGSVKTVKSAPK